MTPCLHIMSLCILRHENVVQSAVYDCLVVAVICYDSPPPVLPLSAITDTSHYEEHTQLSAHHVVVTTSRWQTTPRRALPASNDLSLSLSFLLLFSISSHLSLHFPSQSVGTQRRSTQSHPRFFQHQLSDCLGLSTPEMGHGNMSQ